MSADAFTVGDDGAAGAANLQFAVYGEDAEPEMGSTRSSDTCAPVSRAREDASVASVISITQRVRDRMYKPVPREADDVPERRRIAFRSPWTEDHASPRCIWEDHREAASDIAGEAAGVRWLFWMVAAIPLSLNMFFAAGHVATTRPGRFWGVVLLTGLIVLLVSR